MVDSMASVIAWLEKGISANNLAIAEYRTSLALEDTEDAFTSMALRAIAMYEDGNEQSIKAIEILRNYDKTRM